MIRPALAVLGPAVVGLTLVTGSATGLAQVSASDLLVRLEQLEKQVRQLTGSIEQLQFRNQQLEQSLRRMQEDTDFRFQESGNKGATPAAAPHPGSGSAPAPSAPMPSSSRRSDVFDPAQNPGAPGAPRALGSPAGSAPLVEQRLAPGSPQAVSGTAIGRPADRPLDLSTLAAKAASDPNLPAGGTLPPPPPRNPNATGALATLPPSQNPRDQYDLAYGYLLRKDYALAEDGFRAFLTRYPNDYLAAKAQYGLGESMFQRQNYRDAADVFLTMSKKYEHSPQAAEALLRLGQSLAALHEKELACATFGEVTRKYPRAAAGLRQAVEREQKRARC